MKTKQIDTQPKKKKQNKKTKQKNKTKGKGKCKIPFLYYPKLFNQDIVITNGSYSEREITLITWPLFEEWVRLEERVYFLSSPSRPRLSNLLPTGRMRPARQYSAAREVIHFNSINWINETRKYCNMIFGLNKSTVVTNTCMMGFNSQNSLENL